MDKLASVERLRAGAAAVGVALEESAASRLLRYRDELLRWNEKVNLTAITDPDEVLEKHFLDSLAVLGELGPSRSLMDLGAGAGFPGIPLKVLRPELELTLVETVGKKVGFMKHALATLGLTAGGKAVQCRAQGEPDKEGLPRAEALIARAFMEPGEWIRLAVRYTLPGGRIIAMLGRKPEEGAMDEVARAGGVKCLGVRTYQLPWSGDPRAVAVFSVP